MEQICCIMDTFMKIDNSQGSVLTFIFKQAAGETAWYRFGALIYEKVAAWKRHPIKQLCWQEHYKVELWVKQTITDCNYVHYCLSQLPVPFFGGSLHLFPPQLLSGLTFPTEWENPAGFWWQHPQKSLFFVCMEWKRSLTLYLFAQWCQEEEER